jgi:acyl carrier protein
MSPDVTHSSIRSEVQELVRQITEAKTAVIADEDRLREDLGLDSLDSMELLSCLCERYRVDIEPDDVAEVRTFGQIVEVVRQTLEKRAGDGVPAQASKGERS